MAWTRHELTGVEGAFYFTDESGHVVTNAQVAASRPRLLPSTQWRRRDGSWQTSPRGLSMGSEPFVGFEAPGNSLAESALQAIYDLRFPLAVLSAGGVFALGGAAAEGTSAAPAAAAQSTTTTTTGGGVFDAFVDAAPDLADLSLDSLDLVDWNAVAGGWEGLTAESALQNAELAFDWDAVAGGWEGLMADSAAQNAALANAEWWNAAGNVVGELTKKIVTPQLVEALVRSNAAAKQVAAQRALESQVRQIGVPSSVQLAPQQQQGGALAPQTVKTALYIAAGLGAVLGLVAIVRAAK